MTEERLTEIEAQMRRAATDWDFAPDLAGVIPELLAEVRRLRAELTARPTASADTEEARHQAWCIGIDGYVEASDVMLAIADALDAARAELAKRETPDA